MIAEPDAATLFAGLAAARGVVLAVSGGPDSMALMHLAAAWRPAGLPMWVASVDHGLRAEARSVAEAVMARAGALGLPGRVLVWTGEKPRTGRQARARAARHALLDDYAREVGASHLLLAHTRDDQAETVLMRLAAGSGLHGLAAMRAVGGRHGLTLVRPLLGVGKATLVALCRREGWPFEVDPANADASFARARWRQVAPALAREGLTPERLARFAERMARADAALDEVAARAGAAARLPDADGHPAFVGDAILALPDEIGLRVLGGALAALAPATPLRLERLETCLAALKTARTEGTALRRTLQGCLVVLDREGGLTLRPEPSRRRGRIAPR